MDNYKEDFLRNLKESFKKPYHWIGEYPDLKQVLKCSASKNLQDTRSWSIGIGSIMTNIFHDMYAHSEKLSLWYGKFFNNYNSFASSYDIF